MPELPEVEIARRQLESWLSGRRVVAARAPKTRVLRAQSPARIAQLKGRRLEGIDRVGKWMLLKFDAGEGLISHLGMTGKWVRRSKDEPATAYLRATLELSDGNAVDYRDPRLFGLLVRGKVEQLRKYPSFSALGPDPLNGVDADRLHAVLKKTRRTLKEALMDQRVLAGLGNIYVSEALHRAHLNPQRRGTSLKRLETDALVDAIADSLRDALAEEESDEPITYVEEGGDNFFLVYDRAGERCRTCGRGSIQRIVQGGRSTYFCPVCQPRRPGKR